MAWIQPQGQPASDECPHIHFKTNVIDRDILTKKQHLNLLCTPRGYRWEVLAIKEEEQRLVCSSKPHGKPKRSYVYNVLADLWSVVTPEMVSKLQEMMVTEFGLSQEEASDFIITQMKEMVRTMEKRREKDAKMSLEDPPFPLFISKDTQKSELVQCRCRMPVKLEQRVVKTITHGLASKLAGAAMFMMHGKRGHKQRRMSEVLFKGMCQISGETYDPEKPKNKFHKLQLFLADKLGMWLAEYIVDGKLLARKRKKEDQVIKASALKKAKEYEKEVRHRASLARKIQIQKRVAEERAKVAKRKQEEAKKKLEESRKKKMEEWMKKYEEQKKKAEAMRLKQHGKKSDKEKKTADAKMKQSEAKKKRLAAKQKSDEAKQKQEAFGILEGIMANAEKKNLESKKMKDKQTETKREGSEKPVKRTD